MIGSRKEKNCDAKRVEGRVRQVLVPKPSRISNMGWFDAINVLGVSIQDILNERARECGCRMPKMNVEGEEGNNVYRLNSITEPE